MAFWDGQMESWIEDELSQLGLYPQVEMYVENGWLVSFASVGSHDLDDLAVELEYRLKKYFAGNTWYDPLVFVAEFEPNALEVYIGD